MMRIASSLFVIVAVAACASPAAAPATPAAPTAASPATPKPDSAPADEKPPEVAYAIRYLPGSKWVAGKPPNQQPGIAEHIANMEAWHDRKIVILCGPFLDGTGGMTAVHAASLDEAKRLADEDPGVKSGLLIPEVHPWMLVYGPGE